MEELYWIHVIGNISELCKIIAVLAIVFFVGLIVVITSLSDNTSEWSYLFKKCRTALISSLITAISLAIVEVFTLSKEELYVVYGIGGTIDYIKSNDKAKKLPDKVVSAVDAYLESITDKNNDETVNPADRNESGGK